MKKIVMAFDGSEYAFKALKLAANLAQTCEASLVLAYVVQPIINAIIASPYPPMIDPKTLDEMDTAQRQAAMKMLEQAVASAEIAPLRPECRVLEGPAAETLSSFAAENDAWMVVVGSRGRGAAARVLLGSVSDRLTHICPVPVLVVR